MPLQSPSPFILFTSQDFSVFCDPCNSDIFEKVSFHWGPTTDNSGTIRQHNDQDRAARHLLAGVFSLHGKTHFYNVVRGGSCHGNRAAWRSDLLSPLCDWGLKGHLVTIFLLQTCANRIKMTSSKPCFLPHDSVLFSEMPFINYLMWRYIVKHLRNTWAFLLKRPTISKHIFNLSVSSPPRDENHAMQSLTLR